MQYLDCLDKNCVRNFQHLKTKFLSGFLLITLTLISLAGKIGDAPTPIYMNAIPQAERVFLGIRLMQKQEGVP